MEHAELAGSRPENLTVSGENLTPMFDGSPQTGRRRPHVRLAVRAKMHP